MKIKRYLWILLYALIIALPSIIYVLNFYNLNILLVISGVLGISAYILFSFQFLLASRIKIIDRQFGLDKVYRFHMVIAIVALIFAYLHKILKEMYYAESLKTQLGDFAFIIFIAISVFNILMMVNKLFFKITFIDNFRKFLNQILKIKYQYKVLIHNFTLIGLIFLLIHILLAYSVNSNIVLKSILILYFAVPIGLYFNHKIIKGYVNKSKKYVVSEVINESENIVTLKFKPKNGEVFPYLPGQFLYLTIKNDQIPSDEHPFTISSSPISKDYISVTVKQLGDFTNKLNLAKVGDAAHIDGPFGKFTYLKESNSKKICFIAGGIGITPFLGMLRYMNDMDKNREVVLLWGVRDSSEIICKDELEKFESTLGNFKFVPVFSNDNNNAGEKGFITTDIIKKYVDSTPTFDFYICGPPIMLESQLKNLNSLGISKNSIYFESFSIR